jgi:hypothetical protein
MKTMTSGVLPSYSQFDFDRVHGAGKRFAPDFFVPLLLVVLSLVTIGLQSYVNSMHHMRTEMTAPTTLPVYNDVPFAQINVK